MVFGWPIYHNKETGSTYATPTLVLLLLCVLLIAAFSHIIPILTSQLFNKRTMAEASAADGKMKDLSISETKKKKDGNPKKAAKPQQQPKKKVRLTKEGTCERRTTLTNFRSRAPP